MKTKRENVWEVHGTFLAHNKCSIVFIICSQNMYYIYIMFY